MLSEELKSIHRVLGTLLGKMDPEAAQTLRRCRRNLDDAIDTADHMEKHLCPIMEGK